MKKLNVALIGYKFMGKAHSFGIDGAPFFFQDGVLPVKKVICGRTEALARQAAQRFGWEEVCTDWREVVRRDDIDVVDIAAPTANHRDIAVAAAEAGKAIFCEKPIALCAAQARQMLDAAEKHGVKHMLGHNYRRVPAIALAKKMIDEGKLGRIYHFRGVYLQDWIMDPDFPISWQLTKGMAGGGPHFDLNSHLTDIARFLLGEIDEVVGMQDTFIRQRPQQAAAKELSTMLARTDEADGALSEVTVDDASAFLARFRSGALGTFEASRFAGGRKNYLRFEINGSKGSLVFNFERMNELQYWSKEDDAESQGFRTILVTESCHPYIGAWWPAGHVIGYENTFVNEFADFFRSIVEDTKPTPNFYDGWKNAQVLDAVIRSTQSRTWERMDDQ